MMPAIASDERLSQALLQSLKDGSYPGSEEVVSAELPASALSMELQLISDTREEIRVSASSLPCCSTELILI